MLTLLLQGFENMYDFVENAILLLALLLLYQATDINITESKKHKQALIGLLIGLFMILIMMNPWRLTEGVIFDSRSVLMGVTGLFFGPIATLIAAVIGGLYRISIGGQGVYVGVSTIFLSGFIGLYWCKIKHLIPKLPSFIEYYIFGLVLHIIVLSMFFTLPQAIRIDVVVSNIIPFLVFFPILTSILSIVLQNHQRRLLSNREIDQKQLLLQASIDSAKSIEIYTIDHKFNYLSFNAYHENKMKALYETKIRVGSSSLASITDDAMRKLYVTHVQAALNGESISVVIESSQKKDIYYETIYEPLVNQAHKIVGVTVFAQDITDKKRHEDEILKASYYDPLTNIYNRRYFDEVMKKMDNDEHLPLSIIMADINGLKIMNDAFGHHAGDELLCLVADTLTHCMPDTSIICRTGGDEFTIILEKTTYQNAKAIIEHVSDNLAKKELYGIQVSVSFGISTKIDQEDITSVIKHAEDAMYRHKLFEIASHRSQSIKTILNALRAKNPREEAHSNRVSHMCEMIGKKMELSRDDINLLKMISNLHDIGKIAIDEKILNKPGKLTEEEWDAIKRHPELGYRIVLTSPEYTEVAEDILSHHERYDGKGYPRGLKADEIPLRAKIISICDSYDAMTNDRSYRKALSHKEAIEEIKRCNATQFDPKITNVFLELFEDGVPF
ncbi:MAG: HD domain-containing phosphohydrolase [Acholeplasmataceae bacterium]